MTDSQPSGYSLSIPITIGNVKVVCFFRENIKLCGKKYFSPPHNHGDYEIKYVVAGKSDQIIDDKHIVMKAGDVIVVPPETYHYKMEAETTDDLVEYSLRFSLKKPLDNASAYQHKSYVALRDLLSKLSYVRDTRFELRSFFDSMFTEIEEKDYGFFDVLQSCCQSILIKLIRLSGIPPKNIFKSEELKYLGYMKVKLDTFMHRNYMYDVKLEELAKELNVSRRHASRLVMKEYNKSFIEKLTQVRLEQAKYLLAYTDKDLSVISSDCGFSSHSYFAACFKKYEETTPKQYRTRFKAIKNNTI